MGTLFIDSVEVLGLVSSGAWCPFMLSGWPGEQYQSQLEKVVDVSAVSQSGVSFSCSQIV